jgi:insulysin
MVVYLKSFLLMSLCFSAFASGEEEPAYTIVSDQSRVSILTPSLAKRQTLKIRLTNGLEAYLIADPEATHAGAVLTVEAGSWHDPDAHPGLAHFLEHMLFLGTEKYPVESDYDRFIRAHNGKANAYTASDYTLYLFSIDPAAYEEALDRFAFFFKKPLFNPSGVDRELSAINQEFAKNFNQDGIRENYVRKALANNQHPFHRFNAGNSTALSKVTQKILREWYQDHYSAHLMHLIVYGPYSIEQLKSWIIEDFKDIPSTRKQPSYPQGEALSNDTLGKIVYIEPVKNIRTLRLTWELPPPFSQRKSCKPEKLISCLLGHHGKGSLLAMLKTEGLADDLRCDDYYCCRSCSSANGGMGASVSTSTSPPAATKPFYSEKPSTRQSSQPSAN